ncbi:hypothetical protein [Psychrobacter aestuarii]|uniref:hypothetical protein n=1 Tax=Psychrobacter aestuarii TaxID=556327 RepID=UPI00191A3162|nr:hypothetical protein [Psychrobacter aestuarii]
MLSTNAMILLLSGDSVRVLFLQQIEYHKSPKKLCHRLLFYMPAPRSIYAVMRKWHRPTPLPSTQTAVAIGIQKRARECVLMA